MQKRSRMPRDPNQLAKLIVDMTMGEAAPEPAPKGPEKNPNAVALGRLGGAKGGKARAAKLSPEERSAIAKRGAAARWGRKKEAE